MKPHYRWTILAVGVAAQGALSAVQQGLPALGPALREAFDLSLPEVGLLFGAVTWGVMATLLGWGVLADRIGERFVIASGLGGSAVALAGAAYAPTFAWLVAALVLAGALGASAASASGRAVMGWFGRSERGMALGVRQMAVPVGGALAALSLPAIVAGGGLRGALLALSGVSIAGAVAAAVWLREPPPAPAWRPPADGPPPLRDARVWRLACGSALLVCAQVAMVSFVVLFLHDHHGLSAGAAAAVLAVIQLGGGLARILAGRRSDVTGGLRIPMLRRHAIGMALALALTALLVDAPLAVLVPVLVVAGVSTMSWNGLAITATAELAGRERAGTALGLQGTIMRFPSALAGVGFGALVTATSWQAGFAALTLLPLAGRWMLAPLEGEEHARGEAREQRLAAARAAHETVSPTMRGDVRVGQR